MLRATAVVLLVWALSAALQAQTLTQRGFVEGRDVLFPQEAPNDTTRVVGDVLVREEVFVKPVRWVQFAGGVEARTSTHDQVDERWRLDFSDRGSKRPRFSVRRLTATLSRGPFTLDVGKQFIRWGKTDIVTPTDRFAPRDFLNVVDSEFIAVTGARAVAQVGAGTLEGVWTRFTPSRVPLLDQRWTAVPPALATVPLHDAGATLPEGSQAGLRWGASVGAVEYSVSFFDGFNHLPNIKAWLPPFEGMPAGPIAPEVDVSRVYAPMRSYGADAAVPTPWFTIKGEGAYFTSDSDDEYVLYVVQLERQTGEWVLVGGYAGEAVTARRASAAFSPERGMARSLVGRVAYTVDANRTFAFESAVQERARGAYFKGEYSQARGAHWRATLTGVLLRGDPSDFVGQYRRNSHAALALRYSF